MATEITCDCKVCNGLKAVVGGDGASLKTRTARHNMVRIAHSPFGASNVRKGAYPQPA